MTASLKLDREGIAKALFEQTPTFELAKQNWYEQHELIRLVYLHMADWVIEHREEYADAKREEEHKKWGT